MKRRNISHFYFTAWTGNEPEDDDLDRCNCQQQGQVGHKQCGWCEKHNKPMFMCIICLVDVYYPSK